jgi:hypothetical protein
MSLVENPGLLMPPPASAAAAACCELTRRICFPLPIRLTSFACFDPALLLPLLHFAVLDFSPRVAALSQAHGAQLSGAGVDDATFAASLVRFAAAAWGVPPLAAPRSLLAAGGAVAAKLRFVAAVLRACIATEAGACGSGGERGGMQPMVSASAAAAAHTASLSRVRAAAAPPSPPRRPPPPTVPLAISEPISDTAAVRDWLAAAVALGEGDVSRRAQSALLRSGAAWVGELPPAPFDDARAASGYSLASSSVVRLS